MPRRPKNGPPAGSRKARSRLAAEPQRLPKLHHLRQEAQGASGSLATPHGFPLTGQQLYPRQTWNLKGGFWRPVSYRDPLACSSCALNVSLSRGAPHWPRAKGEAFPTHKHTHENHSHFDQDPFDEKVQRASIIRSLTFDRC